MKKLLILLLFNAVILTSYGQWKNAYASSLKLINADSTHGELDGTEYRNAAGKYRYKENGVWYYRLSTAVANSTFVKLTGNQTIAGIKTFSTPIAIGSGGTGLSTYTTGDILHATATNTLGKLAAVATGNVLLSGGVGAISSWGKVALSTHVSGTLPVANGGTGLTALGSALQVLRVNAGATALEFAAASSTSPGGSANSIQTNNGSGGFAGGNMAVASNSVYNLSAGQNWHLGWNASGSGSSVDARRMTICALGVAFGPLLTDALTALHVEKSISGGGSGGTIGEAIRMRSTYNAITPLVGSGVSINFESETADNNYEVGASIEAVTTDVTSTSEDFDIAFKVMRAGATATEVARLTSLSDFRLTSASSVGPFVTFNRTGGTASTWQLKPDIGTTDFAIQDDVGGQEYLFNTAGTATAVDWVATSDRRLKYHFKPVGSQLDKIATISNLVTNYDRKDNGKNETGFVAQELLKVAPEYVNAPIDTASGYYSVNYAKMVVPLYKGVDELQNEVAELRQEVAELKSIIKEFRRITLEASAK